MPDDNPYAAPTAAIASPKTAGEGIAWRWHVAWLVVFGVNLIAPIMLGLSVARGPARLGMALAIPLMLILGHWLCARSSRLRSLLVTGGVCVGLSQLSLVPQFVAGMISLAITSRVLRFPPESEFGGPEVLTAPGGFLMTVLTGGQLMVAALVCGQVVHMIVRAWERRRR